MQSKQELINIHVLIRDTPLLRYTISSFFGSEAELMDAGMS